MIKATAILAIFAIALIVNSGETEALCDFGCGFHFKPLCTIDVENKTKQFESDCQLSVARCKFPEKNYEVIRKGPCEEIQEAAANQTEKTTTV